jgi:PAS domain S-box-containing protein
MLSFLPISRGERLLAVLNLVSFEDRELPFARRHLLESIAHLAGTFIDRFQAQAALRRAHAELEERVVQRTAEALDLYHHAPCGYHSLAPDGRVLQMNDTELAWLGYRREEVEGRMNLADLLLPASAQEFQAGLARLAAGEPTLKLEAAMRRQDGTSFTVLLTSEAEQDAEGRCGKIRATAIDISERRRVEAVLRASEERHRDLVETVPDWVWETNERGVYVFCGPQARELFGYEPDELLGRTPFDLMPAEEARRVAGLVGPLMARGEAIRGLENVARRKDGSLVTLETNGVPVRDAEGRLTGYRGLDHDLTERKQIEAQLLQAKEAADAANQAKSRFLANMSHEIRTPMNAILGFAQVLQRDPTLNPRQQQHLTTINRSGEHLLRLINDILDMSKIEAGRMMLAPADCDFQGLVDDLTSMFRHRTEERELAFAVAYAPDVPRFIHTDGGKVRQVLLNLLSNAVKFTAQGGIRVGLAAQKLAPGPMRPARCRIQVEVADTGAGIAPEELESVFEAFEQTRVGRRQGGGTGLGMAISRQLARMLGGDLTVTSQVGVGSTFVFTFVTATLDPGDRPVAAEAPRRVVGLAPGRPAPVILVVDDNEVNRELLRQLLVLIGFEVHEATNGTEAVSRCAAGPPALVLMDRHMPGLDGLAATRAIRNLPLPEPPPILIVSANVLGTPAEEWRAAGADGFISKPFREEELLAEIGRWVPVEYVYEAPPGAPAPALAELREQVAGLAPDLRDLLVRTTQSGDITRLRRLIQQEVLPLQPDLGQALSLLSENFDYEAILRLLTPPPEA